MAVRSYDTTTVTTPQRARRSINQVRYYENDPDVGFQLTAVATATYTQGTEYGLYVSNMKHHALKNVLCGKNTLHGTYPNRFVVPAHFFSAARYGSQAAAETAFRASFVGVNILAPGKYLDRVPVIHEGAVEYGCVPNTFIAGDLLTWDWDTTNA
jgi:hypothetical protein